MQPIDFQWSNQKRLQQSSIDEQVYWWDMPTGFCIVDVVTCETIRRVTIDGLSFRSSAPDTDDWMIQFSVFKDSTQCLIASDKHERRHLSHTNINSKKTYSNIAYPENQLTGKGIKVYCFDVHVKDNLLAVGGESDKKPFLSVHSLMDQALTVIGYISDSLLSGADSNTAYMQFPGLHRCIYNLRFASKQQRLMVATDFDSSVLLVDMSSSNVLRLLSTTQVHRDLIQDLLILDNAVFTCSADKTIIKLRVKSKTGEPADDRSAPLSKSRELPDLK